MTSSDVLNSPSGPRVAELVVRGGAGAGHRLVEVDRQRADAGGERAAGKRRRGAGNDRQDDADDCCVAGRVVGGVDFAAAGNGGRVGDACRRILGHADRQRQRRVAAVGGQGIAAGGRQRGEIHRPAGAAQGRGRQSRRQRVDQAHRADGRPGAGVGHGDRIRVGGVALLEIPRIGDGDGQVGRHGD